MTDGRVPIFDFPLISDLAEYVRGDPETAEPGQRVVSDERVWEFVADGERGGELGFVSIETVRTGRPGRTRFLATFDLKGFDPVVVAGFLPGVNSWIGKGSAAAFGGGRSGTVDVEGWNPKKWG